MLNIFGNRIAAIAREITKLYEEVKKDNIENLIQYYTKNKAKGEIVILIEKPKKNLQDIDFQKIDQEILLLIKKMKPKDAISLISQNYNIKKKEVYDRYLKN